MLLDPRNLVHYLLDRGLVTPAEVVDGHFSVLEITRRNRNFVVRATPGRGLFVKQAQDWEPYSVQTLRREAACYLLARDDPDFAALGALLPPFLAFDEARWVLVLGLLPDAESLAEWHLRRGDFSLGVAARLGELLGGYHAHAGARARGAEAESVFPRGVPWILDVVRHNPGHVGPVGPAAREYLDIVSAQPALAAALDAARDGWRRDALVHGDMKWENVLVLPAAEGGGPELRIVDWELGDFGDACWDVGSLFQSYLSCWVLSIADPHAGAAALPGQARFPLERMQPAMAAFWESYVRTRGADPREAAELLRRSMAYAAARMLQTAWEHAVAAPALAPNVLHLLQVGMNVLTRPDDAVVHLLGFEQRRAA